ncbi:uncharacterized protein ALTATR162_LOCUS10190 [Alternaria atra]|uniref:Uncharacterized protein n=1 Tax=Alternaria atra TaxID=119953 RepID=A0A8J2ILT0_9PLEO|nr:uncharacterized protein ALTATR162_LOCUS10190 [Alternaria atra]CAG5182498.1 unnamed protein product [Alternaria atra]
MEIDTTDSSNHSAKNAFGSLSYESRILLLQGPSILLIVSHFGTPSEYAELCSAAIGVVSVDRSRQIAEQADSNNRPYAIEFPVLALAAASQTFQTGYKQCAHVSCVPLAVGNILPGYAMCVLDWLVRCTRSKTPISFLPEKPDIDGEDKWYWLYSYAAMRALGIEAYEDLQQFVERLIDHENLIAECSNYLCLLRALQPWDPIVAYLARRTARQMSRNTLGLSAAQCDNIGAAHPHFAALVNERMQKQTC